MQVIAEYQVSFHRHAQTGKRILRLAALAGTTNPNTFPAEAAAFYMSRPGSNDWMRDHTVERDQPALIDDSNLEDDWKSTSQGSSRLRLKVADTLQDALKGIFSGPIANVKPDHNGWATIEVIAKSALPLISQGGQQSAAARFGQDPDAIDPITGNRRPSGTPRGGARKMTMSRNNQLKSWF